MPAVNVLIYGGGGFSREFAWLLQSIEEANGKYKFTGFVDDDTKLLRLLVTTKPVGCM